MAINKKLYRRQNKKGSIHDLWTVLAIQFDDAIGEAKIVESRCEWKGNSSRKLRTFYITGVDFEPTCRPDEPPVSLLEISEVSVNLIDCDSRLRCRRKIVDWNEVAEREWGMYVGLWGQSLGRETHGVT